MKNISKDDKNNYRKCPKCKKILPATTKYFAWRNKAKNQLYPYCKECRKQIHKETYNYEKRRPYFKEHTLKTIEKRRKYRENNKEKVDRIKRAWQEGKAAFKTYAHRLTIEEDPIDDGKGYILVKCTYCGKYFYPTTLSVSTRIKCLSNSGHGEGRLYCSNGCKNACPIFNQQKWPKGFKPATSTEVDPLIRQMCLARDDYTCQKCEKTIEEIELHAHHIEGVTQQSMLANDVDNTITLCKPCHKWVHKQKDCTYYDLKCK